MKRFRIPFLILLAVTVFTACQKENSGKTATAVLDASKTAAVKKGEPVYFTFSSPSGSAVNWSVSPSANARLTASGSRASVLFSQPGEYSVTASSGSLSSNRRISVLDSSIVIGDTILPHDTGHIAALTGDRIKITLTKLDSSRSGFAVHAETYNSYNCMNNYLLAGQTETSAGVTISYSGVYVPPSTWCSGGTRKAETTNYYFPSADGTYEFKVKLNGVVYTGSFIKTGSSYTFNWPYTTGVTISPFTL